MGEAAISALEKTVMSTLLNLQASQAHETTCWDMHTISDRSLQCISNTSRLVGLTLSDDFINNSKYFIFVSVLSADPREFLLFFPWVLLKVVFEINRQLLLLLSSTLSTILSWVPFYSHLPLQGNVVSFLISYLGTQMEEHPEVWHHPAGQCHLADDMMSFLNTLVIRQTGEPSWS